MTIQAFFDKASQRKNFINELSGRALVGAQDTQFNPKAHFICFDPVFSADKARLIMLARNCGAVLINDAADDAVTGIFAKKYENLLKEGYCAQFTDKFHENYISSIIHIDSGLEYNGTKNQRKRLPSPFSPFLPCICINIAIA